MENPVMVQLLHFSAAILFGGAAGVWYEICGLFAFMGRKWRRLLFDLLFWAVLLPGAFLFLLFLNGGGPRGYLMIGMASGLILVRFTMGVGLARLLAPLRHKLYVKRCKRKAQKRQTRAQKRIGREQIWQKRQQFPEEGQD
jgi:hypothetical protein